MVREVEENVLLNVVKFKKLWDFEGLMIAEGLERTAVMAKFNEMQKDFRREGMASQHQ